jgi:hypothetical protein
MATHNTTAAQRRQQRRYYARHYAATYGPGVREHSHTGQRVIPENVTILTRDPAPCFRCATNGGCKHRPCEGRV